MGYESRICAMLKNPLGLSFRGVRQPTDDEESRKALVFRARFLAEFTLSSQSESLRRVYPERSGRDPSRSLP